MSRSDRSATPTKSRPGRPERPAVQARVPRSNDPEATMADILKIATAEFAAKGLSGARIDDIAEVTRTSKRMIYYYFGSKEGLYIRVLEEAYRRIRSIEAELHLDDLAPEEAVRRLVRFTLEYQWTNQDFIRLVMTENIHRGEFLSQSQSIRQLNIPAIDSIRSVYDRGVAEGVFRPGLDPIDLHMSISALSTFNVANQHTFSLIFGRGIDIDQRAEQAAEMLVRYLRA
ncbi:MAG: HTH-type transcriptional repressor NicS [Paracidovorax wautersii]|uniref:HTH-type transcriptional repressor NicS n=1 Tax=Paracidovorax wautersii TaxID=1177982 RepID=A0A7V8JPK1_9BURK|nr:MAG: HTH-type transcriptional repressor NicS [Paracidovorax wautersii]